MSVALPWLAMIEMPPFAAPELMTLALPPAVETAATRKLLLPEFVTVAFPLREIAKVPPVMMSFTSPVLLPELVAVAFPNPATAATPAATLPELVAVALPPISAIATSPPVVVPPSTNRITDSALGLAVPL